MLSALHAYPLSLERLRRLALYSELDSAGYHSATKPFNKLALLSLLGSGLDPTLARPESCLLSSCRTAAVSPRLSKPPGHSVERVAQADCAYPNHVVVE